MDIRQAAAKAERVEDEGTVVHLKEPDESPAYFMKDGFDEPQPVTITVAGAHSSRYRRAEEDQRQRRLKRSDLTAANAYHQNLERAVACTIAWDGLLIDGQPIPFTKANVEQVYRSCNWIYEDIVEAIHDHQRFFGNGSKRPASMSPSTPA